MTLPRHVLPGCDYMITRRCSERRFFLRPDDETNNAFIYCLGLAAARAKVDILFVAAMSNHYHAGIHDPNGSFPVFAEHFHALLARCQNAHLGRFEAFWSSDPTSAVRLVEPGDVLAKMVYAFANPCAADLVDTCDDWPGVSSFEFMFSAGTMTAIRPTFFFRSDGDQPDAVTVPIRRPQAFVDLSADQWRNLVVDQVRAREAEHRERRRAAGKSVLGRQAVLSQRPCDAPQSTEPHFGVNPRIAARSKWTRIEAIQRGKAFIESYRVAIESWMSGSVDVLFPFGTYWMRKFAHVVCDTAEAAKDAIASATTQSACLGIAAP